MSPHFNYPHNASLSFTFILKGDFILWQKKISKQSLTTSTAPIKNCQQHTIWLILQVKIFSNAATIKTVLDEVGIDILQEDTRIVAIAQTILEVPEKERMRLTFRDPIHIELIDSSLEIFIDKKCCHISSDLQFWMHSS